MVINGTALLEAAPIADMVPTKKSIYGLSYGLSEVGYDIRLKQRIEYDPPSPECPYGATRVFEDGGITHSIGRVALGSSVELFQIPNYLWCEFRNKSTHARNWIDATLCTDGEPGWSGHLTIELIFHGMKPVVLKEGSPILKAVFHVIMEPVQYDGKYQNQPDRPVPAIYGDIHK